MTSLDTIFVLRWWLLFFIIGVIFLPLTTKIFSNFFDRGYIFSKVIGIALISYVVFVLGFLKVLPFETQNIFIISGVFLLINFFIKKKNPLPSIKSLLPIFIFEECMFLAILIVWSFIHAHAPDIHGLEKYMDFGFINSILRTKYFPPLDMWLTPFSINYYYFGHLVTAVLTKLLFLPSAITFNLMLAAIAALGFTSAFSIIANLLHFLNKKISLKISIIGGLLSAFLLIFAGNLHTIYLFFTPYQNENPVPFWQLVFSPSTYPNSYWYPNATRFIHNTIHEFPIYSSVVSDLHGHFLDIPFVLLTIAILLSLINSKHEARKTKQIQNVNIQNLKRFDNFNFGYLKLFRISDFGFRILLLAFMLAIMYMINAWDGIIYLLLTAIVILIIQLISKNNNYILYTTYYILFILAGSFFFSLPFNLNFKPFASGIGILCAPKFLTDIGELGPFLFEQNHCQRSPLWQLGILYGFFYFWVISFIVFKFKIWKLIKNWKLPAHRGGEIRNLPSSDIFIGILIILSTLLIIVPEFIYVKDIYPAHYRANTMFKLVYQSFIMLSLSSGYIIVRLVLSIRYYVLSRKRKILTTFYLILATFLFILVSLYPYFAINSYFGNLKIYSGLNGTTYLKNLYPNDNEAILWINKNIQGQPVILEAQGDSYTDYARVSVNTGLPTVLGWTVHEWLWRGTYDIPAPRIPEIQKLYESDIYDKSDEYYVVQPGDYLIKIAAAIKFGDWRNLFDLNKDIIQNPSLIYPNQKLKIKEFANNDINESKLKDITDLIKKYNISYVFVGDLERQKYPKLNEEKFKILGKIIYQRGNTKIFQINIRWDNYRF